MSRLNGRRKAPPLTATEARTFLAGERVGPMMRLSLFVATRQQHEQHPPDCKCEPYRDFYTMRRWRPQGRSLRKGVRGFPLPVVMPEEKPTEDEGGEGENGRRTRPRFCRSWVFCRCMTCATGEQAAKPWPWSVTDEARDEERRKRIVVDPDNPATIEETAAAMIESGDLAEIGGTR